MAKILSLGLLFSLCATLFASSTDESFDWHSITPSENLAFYPCWDGFACARLLLPLDWINETRSDTVSIAIIKLPAVVPQDDETFGGAIFTNPGGPGGSGVDYLRQVGSSLQHSIDIPMKRHYEVISFDPRGIGASEPLVDCYPANSLSRDAQILETIAGGALDLSPASLIYGFMTAKGFGRRCSDSVRDLLPFVNTPSVARDMVAMVDQLDKLRKEEMRNQRDTDGHLELRRAEAMPDDVPRLQYIGFSYGTILGNYFASLFPERVGRVVLDGVCNTDDYANGPGWLTNTVDADHMVDIFYEGCFGAGADVCKLRRPEDQSPNDIKKRVNSWIESLDIEPLIATTTDGAADIVLRSGDARGLIGMMLYSADYTFPIIANLFHEALHGNTGPLASFILRIYSVTQLTDACPINNGTAAINSAAMSVEPRTAVLCTDGDDVTGKNGTYWRSYLDDQVSVSAIFGGLWTAIRLLCAGWQVRPNWSFKGPFTTPKASRDASAPEKGRPAAPLLFMSSRWDPVTPLRAARAMASNHPGAGLLIQESMGHSVLGIGVASACTRKVVSEYFDKGTVPDEEVVCEGVRNPWDQVSAQDAQVLELAQRRTRYRPLGV